jgi:hypothetical protein
MFAKEKVVASATGGLSWLVQDVLVADENVLAAALIGGILGTWLTSDKLWKYRGNSVNWRGLWVLGIGFQLGMGLILVVVCSSWAVYLVPNIPVVGGLVEGVPAPAMAGMLSLFALAVVPRVWPHAIKAAERFFGSRWRT